MAEITTAADHQASPAARLLARRRFIELAARRPVDDFLSGSWESRRPGSGYEFETLREMAPGDPVRLIDWGARARTGKLYVREFLGESFFRLHLVCDLSASMAGGRKAALMAEIAVSLAWSAISTGNPCGLLLWAAEPAAYLAPAVGREHLLALTETLARLRSQAGKAFAANRAAAFLREQHAGGLVFFLADFLDNTSPADLVLPGTEVKVVQILEESEKQLPPGLKGLAVCRDPESGRQALVDLARWRRYNRAMADYLASFQEGLRRLAIAATVITPADDYVPLLNRLGEAVNAGHR
ncbi:MAG: DUF58 domain-containing protein [Deltaproteobacteria bacterium]|nr:DUF58 domain-containing protein [Deltaproteobacteria bacterium]